MARKSAQILEFQKTYNISEDEVWEVHGSSWVVKHKALERVAVEIGIIWDKPDMILCDLANKMVVICAYGRLGEKQEWSFGEASPANNKNSYPVAMAEKRAKDRVILKLLTTHGALYSEAEFEADEKPATLAKKDAKEVYTKLQAEMRQCPTREALKEWGAANKDRIALLPEDWQDTLRLQFEEQMADLRNKEAA